NAGAMPLDIPHRDSVVRCELYKADSRLAVICVGGVGGGTHGPANIYHPLAERLASDHISSLLINCRYNSNHKECISDMIACIEYLDKYYHMDCVGLIGWSFGGAVAISAAVMDPRVRTVVAVASQSYGTGDVYKMPASLLLIHGTGDRTLPYDCSVDIAERAHKPKKLVLFPEGDHDISQFRDEMLILIRQWVREHLECT
ncbi:MAG TPA: dienelactone hydrolase family protein, partial [Methanocella sp.]|nr:dienelactone hydrolase family protein [Methanocella sp.]